MKIFATVLFAAIFGAAWLFTLSPSLERDWQEMDRILPVSSWSGDVLRLENIRDYVWTDQDRYVPRYHSGVYDLADLVSVDYFITPFSHYHGPAHTMVSFGFIDGRQLVISAEIRKEQGESFSALKWAFRQYELTYVIATEEDIVQLRTHHRGNEVYLYPLQIPLEKKRALFRSMIARSDALAHTPEWYNTLINNCTTNLLDHANSLRVTPIRGWWYGFLPADSDRILYRAGLIDTSLTLQEARERARIDIRARSLREGDDFSVGIRQ